VRRALCLVAWLVPLAICLSTCIRPRPMPEALDPAVVEAEIVKAKGFDLAKAEPGKETVVPEPPTPRESPKEPVIAMAEPPKEPAVPRPEPPKEPIAPRPEAPKEPTPPKEPVPPRPEPPKEPVPPKPEPPKEPTPPKPEPPKEPTPPKPEPPKEPTPPKPEPPKEPTPPTPEPPTEPTPPKPEPPKPEPPKEPTPPSPEPPKEPTPPKPEPPKEPVPPEPKRAGGPFLVSSLPRTCYAPGETAEYTVVVASETDVPDAVVTLSVASDAGETWTATDALGPLAAGRHSVTYGVDVACFPQGAYKVSARVGEQQSEALALVVAPAAPRTHFRLAGWLSKPPKGEIDAQRWSRFLGLNTVLLQDRSAWGAESALVMDTAFSATSRGIGAMPDARPMEAGLAPPPFVQAGDRLTAAGLEWLNACAVSGGSQGPLMPGRDLTDPLVVRGAHHRIHQRIQAERRFRNFAGVLFTDETLLPRASTGDSTTPFGVPAHIAAYKKLFDATDVPWQQGSQRWDDWYPYVMFRAGILGECLADWAAAARAVSPECIATSLLASPTELSNGVYPPLQAKGLPVITTSASLTGPAGMMMPAVVADLERAGNWGKPLWFAPEVADDADLDEIRVAVFLALARKIDGVVYPKNVDYHLDRPATGPGPMDVQASISSVNHLLTRLGDFLLALEKPRDDVAILYSATEHIERMGRDPVKNPDAPAYPWTLVAAYNACMFAHFPAVFVTEDELLSGRRTTNKVILAIGLTRIRPEVKGALEQHIAAGGVVLTDTTTKVAIEGARPLGIEFPDLHQYHQNPPVKEGDEESTPDLERRDAVVQARLLYPLLGTLRTVLKQHIERDYTSSDPDTIVCDQQCGAGRYIFLINNTQRTDFHRGLKWELAAARTRVTFREGEYAVYEAIEGKRVYPMRDKGHPTLSLILPSGALRLYALLPEAIRGVRIGSASLGREGLRVSATVYGEARAFFGSKAINAAIPLEVTVADPAGRERLRVYRAHSPKGYAETLPLGRFEQPGRWTLRVTELLSGQSASTTFRVGSGSASWASRRGPLAVFDGERTTALLRSGEPLLILVGTEEEAAKAEPLAAALRTDQRTVEVRLAAELAKPRTLSSAEAARYLSAAPDNALMPDIRQAAILLGEAATHPLIQQVHNSGVVPRTVTPDCPGPGGALLCCVVSAFEPDVPVIVAAAADPAGVDAAIEALLAASRGTVPRVAWRAVSTSRELASGRPQPRAPSPERLAPAWRYRGSDVPTCAAAPLQGTDVTVGFYDGMVFTFNSTGKEMWRRRCTTRTRAVARSLDGIWAAIGSFPEVLLVSAQGRLQFGVPMEEPGPRADHTAVALSPDGTLTLAGTRKGVMTAYDLQGNKVFAIGDTDADEQKEGWQSRLGCINDLCVSPRTGNIVVGGELATIGVDPKGEELWAAADANRVTSVASSFGEEQTVAVGSRTGLVACISSGTVLWRNQADACVTSVCFRGESQEILAASLDGTLTCYDKNGKALWTHRSPLGFRYVASSLDGSLVAAAELAGRVLLLNKTGQVVVETEPVDGAIRAFAFSADGERLTVGTASGEVLTFKNKRAAVDQDEL